MLKILKIKHYFIIGLSLIVFLGGGIWYVVKNQSQEVATQTLKIEKVYGMTQLPGGGQGGRACLIDNDCTGSDICYVLEGPRNCPNGIGDCTTCGNQYECRNMGGGSQVCYGSLDGQFFRPCGICGAPPVYPDSPDSCAEVLPQNPAYKFSIRNPGNGNEGAYISAEGYLALTGTYWDNSGGQAMQDYLSADNQVNWCYASPAGVFRIDNDQGQPIAAFIACDPDGPIDFISAGQTQYFVDDGDFSGSNNFVVKSLPFDDMTAAWINNNGALYLRGCVAQLPF